MGERGQIIYWPSEFKYIVKTKVCALLEADRTALLPQQEDRLSLTAPTPGTLGTPLYCVQSRTSSTYLMFLIKSAHLVCRAHTELPKQ